MMNSMSWRTTKKRSTEFTQNSISIAFSSLTGYNKRESEGGTPG